jgi:cytochrome c553
MSIHGEHTMSIHMRWLFVSAAVSLLIQPLHARSTRLAQPALASQPRAPLQLAVALRSPAPSLVPSTAPVTTASAGPMSAPSPAPVTPPSTVEACKACHGPQGISRNPTFPNLAGQKAGYLEAQLKAFKAKDRKNDYMNVIAAQLSDADVHTFALFWSSLPATPAADTSPAGPAVPSRMTLPANFPKDFTAYQTESEEGVITKRYANSIAWKAAKANQSLPSGSILLQVSYTAEKDAAGKEVSGAVQSYSAMESRAGWGSVVPELLRNGDWDYALFTADGKRRDQLNQAPCLACHKAQEANSYVFTLDKLRKAAS